MINMYQKFDTRGAIPGFPEDAQMIPRIANVANLYPAVTVTNERVQDMLRTSFEHSMDVLRNDSHFLARPEPGEPVPKPVIEYLSPLFDLQTCVTIDMEIFLNYISTNFIGKNLTLFT